MSQAVSQLSDTQNLPALPEGWVWTKLGEIGGIYSGYGFPKKYQGKTKGDIPFFKVRDISRAFLDSRTYLKVSDNYISMNECREIKAEPLKTGTIVFAKIGEAIKLNRRAILSQDSLVDNNVMGFYPVAKLANRLFIFYFLLTLKFEDYSRATTVPSIRKSDVEQIFIPLPPLPEQHRIVAKIEELFTRLDAGIEALNKIKAQLKRYRQAVLRDAFQGKLTQEWREAHKGELEPASILLERIKEERRKNARGKYKELLPLDTSDLPDLPEEWVYLTLDYLVSSDRNSIRRGPFGSAIKKAFFVPYGYKVYEQGNVIYSDFQRGGYFIDDKKFDEMKGFQIKPGDVLMTCSGTVGRIAVVPEGIQPGIINQALLKITLNNKVVNTPYFFYLFRSRIGEVILANTRGSAMLNISSVEDLRQIPLAIPSLAEQHKIVEEIERRLSIADEIEKTVDRSLKQADRLRQSILKRAFEGKLAPQDPADEPAARLLERIKDEKSKQQAKVQSPNKGRKTLKQGKLLL